LGLGLEGHFGLLVSKGKLLILVENYVKRFLVRTIRLLSC